MATIGQITRVVHRLLEFLGRALFLLVAALRGPAESQPPIEDLTLLHSATTLAMKIRNKQVIYFSTILLCKHNVYKVMKLLFILN